MCICVLYKNKLRLDTFAPREQLSIHWGDKMLNYGKNC